MLAWLNSSLSKTLKPHLSAGAPAGAPSVSNIPSCRSVSFRGSSALRLEILQESWICSRSPQHNSPRVFSYADILVELCLSHEVKVERKGRYDGQLSHWAALRTFPSPIHPAEGDITSPALSNRCNMEVGGGEEEVCVDSALTYLLFTVIWQ